MRHSTLIFVVAAFALLTLSRLDGVLLTGGGDLDACHYDGADHAGISGVDDWRDRTEIALVRQLVEGEIPFFGICRGCQVLNVALGGTLHPEVAEVSGAIRHTYYPGHPFDLLSHWVDVNQDSRLAALVGERRFQVNSLHHQSIAQLATGLQAAALAPDGLVEAVEVRGHPFGLAVQWHPEVLPGEASTRALFAGFVEACRGRLAR